MGYRHTSFVIRNEKLFNEFKLLANLDNKSYTDILWRLISEHVYGRRTTIDSFTEGNYIQYPEITAPKQIIYNIFNKMDFKPLEHIEKNVDFYHKTYYNFLNNRKFNTIE